MGQKSRTPSERFNLLAEAFAGAPGVTLPFEDPTAKRDFGSSALKVASRIFAIPVDDRLVVKLAKKRVDALVAAGQGSGSIRATMVA